MTIRENEERIKQRRRDVIKAALRAKEIPVEKQTKEAALFIASVYWATYSKKG